MDQSTHPEPLSAAQIDYLERATRRARGIHVWAHGDAYQTVSGLCQIGLLRMNASEWGDDWARVTITGKGQGALGVDAAGTSTP